MSAGLRERCVNPVAGRHSRGPSTPSGAKCAPDFAEDDGLVEWIRI
jgi:hypothetical protein